MRTVLVAGDIHPAGVKLLRSTAGLSVHWVRNMSLKELDPFLLDAEAVLWRTQPLRAETLDKAPKLQLISRYGVGLDAIDLEAVAARNIALATVGDVNSRSVAEHTILMMLAASRRLSLHDRALRSGNWDLRDALDTEDLYGKRLLVVGFGRIGRLVAQLAAGLGLEVSIHDPFRSAEDISDAGFRPRQSLDAALAEADVLSVHVPKAPGAALVGARELAFLPKGALVINTARGGLVDEVALLASLRSGHIGGAGLDVFEAEPPDRHSDILCSDRIVLSPHNAGLTEGCARRMSLRAARSIVEYFDNCLDQSFFVKQKH